MNYVNYALMAKFVVGECFAEPRSQRIVLCPNLLSAQEFMRVVFQLVTDKLGFACKRTEYSIEFVNGSVIKVGCDEQAVRGSDCVYSLATMSGRQLASIPTGQKPAT